MKIEKYSTSFGEFKVFANCKEIARAVREDRVFHPKVANWIKTNLKDNSSFIDIGANIGIYSVLISLEYPSVNTISLEAHPEVYSLLRDNKELNSLDNMFLINNCASNRDGEVNYMERLIDSHKGNYGNNKIVKKGEHKVISIRTDSIKLEKPASVIKIDVQGFDFYALLGCDKIIEKDSPTIIIEWEPEMAVTYNHSFNDVHLYLETFGYKLKEKYNKDYMFVKQ